jgi:hypothetical protein
MTAAIFTTARTHGKRCLLIRKLHRKCYHSLAAGRVFERGEFRFLGLLKVTQKLIVMN